MRATEPHYSSKTPRLLGAVRSLWLIPVGMLLAAATSVNAQADIQTRIVSINGNYATTHDAQLTVQPGDTLQLTADSVDFDYTGNANPQNRYAEDFTWSSDANGSSDVCDPQYDCSGTNFEVNQYGVSFYVPYTMGASVTLTVQNRSDGTYDQITLYNGSYASAPSGGYTPPSGSYSDPTEYPDSDFDYNRGLAGHGRWVYIGGERCFVPYSYQNDWQPYQHGYWYWTSYGWTWHSYDPWGWVTDHYGYWRHHTTYGWTWFPFATPRWYPAVVTFFHTSGGIGWYPYYSGYSQGYTRGYAHGYDDGYWDGYNRGFYDGVRSSRYYWGGTYVTSSNFISVNVYSVRVTNVYTYYGDAYSSRSYGPVLIGAGYNHPRVFVESRIGRSVPMTQVNVITRNYGGRPVQFVAPAQRVEVPQYYRQAQQQSYERVRSGRAVPIGSVYTPGGQVQRPQAPVVVAPRMPDRNGGYQPMPPRTRTPVNQPRPQNPNPPSRPTYPTPGPSRPSQPAPGPSRPTYPTPGPSRPTYPTPGPSRPSQPAPGPSRPTQPAPGPSRPDHPAPGPSRPTYPSPAPSRPSQPAPGPSRPTYPSPAPSRPSQPAPAPSRPSYPSPAPSRPSYPSPAPSRPSYPSPAPSRPSNPSPAPSRPSYPSPAPSRPSQPSHPAPGPSRPTHPGRPR